MNVLIFYVLFCFVHISNFMHVTNTDDDYADEDGVDDGDDDLNDEEDNVDIYDDDCDGEDRDSYGGAGNWTSDDVDN
jgi:hypothetical protein